jgi:hypothetical protein
MEHFIIMKKRIMAIATIAILGMSTFVACNKAKKETPPSQIQPGDKKVTRLGGNGGEKPFRRYLAELGDCDNVQENCAPEDVEINSTRDNSCMPCRVLRELLDNTTFRAEATFGYNHIRRNFPEVSSQEALNQVDNQTFYATLFPNLTNSQREMFYSGTYQILLKHKEGQEKFFILFGRSGERADQIESHPVFVVPFTLNYN